jgi:hypothetical protein
MFFELNVNALETDNKKNEEGKYHVGFFCDNEEWRKMLDRIKDCDLKDYLRIHRGYE